MKITSKQIRKIIMEEIQLALKLPAQYDEYIDSCPEPATVEDAWYPSDVMPEEDAWAGGDNLESSVDWAHTATGESNAGPHVPVESSTVVDDDTATLETLEAVIAAILGDSLDETLLEQSDVEDSQDNNGDKEEDDDDKDKDDGDEDQTDSDDVKSADGGETESQPDLGEQLTLPIRNKGGWQRWSGGNDAEPTHEIYESLRQLIRHEIITEQLVQCPIASFDTNEVFLPQSKGFIELSPQHGREQSPLTTAAIEAGQSPTYSSTEGGAVARAGGIHGPWTPGNLPAGAHLVPIGAGEPWGAGAHGYGVHVVSGRIMNIDDAMKVRMTYSPPEQVLGIPRERISAELIKSKQDELLSNRSQLLINSRCANFYLQGWHLEEEPSITLNTQAVFKSYGEQELHDAGWRSTIPQIEAAPEEEIIYASPEPPELPE